MALLKGRSASGTAREALDEAERVAASAERTYRLVIDTLASGQSVEVAVGGTSALYAELFSISGSMAGTMILTLADGTVLASHPVNAAIASHTFALPQGSGCVFRFTASGAISAARLLLSVKGGAFFAA